MNKFQQQKQNLVEALTAFGIQPESFAKFLEVNIEVSEAAAKIAQAYTRQTERAIHEAKLIMIVLQQSVDAQQSRKGKG
jgi:hypothetical protein